MRKALCARGQITKMRKDEENYEEISLIAAGVDYDPESGHRSGKRGNDRCALFGGLISGIGSGLAIRYGGAMDGIEVVAVVFAKKLGISVGTFVLIYNVLLYIICGIVRGSWILPLYSIVTYAAGSKTVDFIVDGLDSAKAAMIITTRPDQICQAVSEEFGTGLTILDAHGYYSNTSKTVLYVVVNRFQIVRLKTIVKGMDPCAYMAISPVADLLHGSKDNTGEGF